MLDPLIRSVVTMMARWGGPATLTVDSGESTYDPETSTTTPAIKDYRIRVIAQDYIQRGSGITLENGSMVKTGDKQFFIQPDAAIPKPRPGADYIIFEGSKWNVISFKDYNPSGSKSYMYEVYARI